jgi:hypothetical protein
MAMAKNAKSTPEEARHDLFDRLRAAKASIVETTARDTDIEAVYLEPAFEQVLDLVSEPVPGSETIALWREEGVRLARAGAMAERVLDGYLSLNWAIWEVVMKQGDIAHEVVLDFADRLLRGLDDAIAAISEGYIRVEVEAAAAHSDERRAVLEEILTAPRTTPEDRARIRRRGERHGLPPQDAYRLILVHAPERSDEDIEGVVDRLEKRVRVPQSHHRRKPGIRLPVVLDWRGRVLVFAKAEWAGEKRLKESLVAILGDDLVAVDTGPVAGCEPLADALAQADYTASVASSLGRRGWISDPGELALETTFLLDDELVRAAIEQELGPLLADARMGEELVTTLEVYLGARQNIREAARQLHLAPRTVAYRLERIETLLGHKLEGDVTVRLSAALLALRVTREAGRATE